MTIPKSTKQAILPGASVLSPDKHDNRGNTLLFVPVQPQISGSTPKRLATRVRQHVIHHWVRNRLKQSPEEVITSGDPGLGNMQSQRNRFRLEKGGHKVQNLKPLTTRPRLSAGSAGIPEADQGFSSQELSPESLPIQDPVSSYRRDPFIIFPIPVDDRVQSLFTFYLNDLNNKNDSQNSTRDFIPIALGDAACFHVLMATLLQYQRFQGAEGGVCFWYHRGAAIKALNQELSSHNAHITDVMFCTVGMLLYLETRVPNLRSQTARLHIAALIKFLELRRGVLKVELYCMLLRLAIWCSINPPLTRPPALTHGDHQLNLEIKLPCSEYDFTPFPTDIFYDLRLLVRLSAEYGCDPKAGKEDERRNFVYHSLVSQGLARASASLSSSTVTSLAESNALRCIQLGQILFLYTICPAMSVAGVYSQSLAIALRACLEIGYGDTKDRVLWSPELLCWLLVNGAITKQAKNLQSWYLRWLAEFIRIRKIQTFEQLKVLLCKIVWTEDHFGPACRSIWRESLSVGNRIDR